jgi:hypothetical protein
LSENISNGQKHVDNLTQNYLGAKLSVVTSLPLFIALNVIYAENKSAFLTSNSSPFYPDLSLILLSAGSILILYGVLSFLRAERKRPMYADGKSRVGWSIGRIISDAFFQHAGVIALAGIVYGVFFAFVDGILIYQPTVDFHSAYGFASPGALVETCCGPPGYIPVGLVYFPAQHFGVQLIPISVVIMMLVSFLVGVNVSLIVMSVRKSKSLKQESTNDSPQFRKSSFMGGALGAAFGLFAGCPTCAAVFFLSMIAGSGATAFSLVISEYQPVIIALSIPLLLASIIWQARSIRTILHGCSV